MRRFLTSLVLSSLLISTFPATYAQRSADKAKKAAASVTAQRGVETIAANQIRDYLTFIASDEMEGRDTPSRGLDTAAKFIAMNLSRWGFKPAGDDGTFFQKIALKSLSSAPANMILQIGAQDYRINEDYFNLAGDVSITDASLVFAGNSWMVKSKNL